MKISSFPSPHSGILFLYAVLAVGPVGEEEGFPSPHSGILFLWRLASAAMYFSDEAEVSVPSFGDSFFMRERG